MNAASEACANVCLRLDGVFADKAACLNTMKQSEQDNFTFGAGVEATQDGENVAFLHEQKR